MNKTVKLVADAVAEIINSYEPIYDVEDAMNILEAAAGGRDLIPVLLESDQDEEKDSKPCQDCDRDDCVGCDCNPEEDDDEDEEEDQVEFTLWTDHQGRINLNKQILEEMEARDLEAERTAGFTVARNNLDEIVVIMFGNHLDKIESGEAYDSVTFSKYQPTNGNRISVSNVFGPNARVKAVVDSTGALIITRP